MGRYYNGDIEGKFWFGIQASDDASFFGGCMSEPNYINYYFDNDDLSDLETGLEKCKKELGDKKEKLDKFFEQNSGYNEQMIIDAGISDNIPNVKHLLEWYARLLLGENIYKCVKENGSCDFEAEL